MAKKKREKKETGGERSLKSETIQGIVAIACFALAVFLVLAWLGKASVAGQASYNALNYLFGVGFFILPLILVLFAAALIKSIRSEFGAAKIVGAVLFFFSGLALISLSSTEAGGLAGKYVTLPFEKLFGTIAGSIFLVALLAISLLIMFDTGLSFGWLTRSFGRFRSDKEDDLKKVKISGANIADTEEGIEDEDSEESGDETDEEDDTDDEKPAVIKKPVEEKNGDLKMPAMQFRNIGRKAVPIPLSLLEKDHGTPGVGDVKAKLNIIKRTLQTFGIEVEMDEVTIGPTVTRYALKPAEGVKLSRIVGLQNDLALKLAAHPLRIEAPIPGKSLVGIEIPNSTKSTVGLASMLGSDDFQYSDKPLLVSLGKSIAGKSSFGNLGKMPHLLIAGATGSGKSVTIHAIITSLLYRNSPEAMRFIMIDPKRVELTLYNGIPHLLTPVITEAKKTIMALKWAAKEMDRRYDILETEHVRDIESYHKNILEPALKKLEGKKTPDESASPKFPETMPYIVIVIDELADIMSMYPRELEASIVRLAQMSRAVGIHLVLSTQRPSVNVITGLIKANIPARIALQVSSQIDSRTILDTGGAEKLLGAGDMLYLSGDMSKPARLQSAFISEAEVKKVVKFLKDAYADVLTDEISIGGPQDAAEGPSVFDMNLDKESLEDDDELYEQAREEVVRAQKASTSYLQRKLSVGYARAARLMDILEERGVIGPGQGAKPREVLVPRSDEGAPQETQEADG